VSVEHKIDFRFKIGRAFLDEVTKEYGFSINDKETRIKLDDLKFERAKRSGAYDIRHADGSTTPSRK